MRRFGLLVTVLAASGISACSSSSGGSAGGAGTADGVPLLAGFAPDPAPANGFRLVLPIVHGIQPGDSTEMCTWTDKILDQDLDIKMVKGQQSVTGHHVVIYYTKVQQPPGTQRVCLDSDMADFRYTVGAGGEGVNQTATMPGDLVAHIPKGSQIVINHHYLNASAKPYDAQSAVLVTLNAPGAPAVHSGALAFVDSALEVPPGNYGMDIKCTMTKDTQFWMLIPHMHAWGSHITVDHTSVDAAPHRLFDVPWLPEYAFHPPAMTLDPTAPYVMKKGDTLNVHCDFNNSTAKSLPFGVEMCVAFGETINADNSDNIACDGGHWGPF